MSNWQSWDELSPEEQDVLLRTGTGELTANEAREQLPATRRRAVREKSERPPQP